MSQSPSKRQRTSVDTFIPRGNGELVASAQSNPTTPTRRASYLSPTKASLARSHPKLLLKSPGRNGTESRSRRGTSNTQGAQTDGAIVAQTSPANTSGQHVENAHLQRTASPQPQGSLDGLNLATTIAQLFRDVPSGPGMTNNEGVVLPPPQADRKPLSPRQPRTTSNADRARKSYDDEQVESILPRLVKQTIDSSRPAQNAMADDMDLPPTPVQLGLSQAPYRPRGLASSSSGGSRSGSGRNRVRVRNNETRSITSSPLKPRDRQPVQPMQKGESQGDAEEAAESETDEASAPSQANISTEAKQRLTELSELRNSLASLRQDIEKLETLSEKMKNDDLVEISADLQDILTGNEHYVRKDPDALEAHASFVKDPEAFLKLFAPANLQLLHSTRSKVVKKRPKVIHTLTVTAPKPWLPATIQLTFDVTVDTENASIDSISQLKPGFLRKHEVLQTWLDDRLSNALHQYDIAGLIVGAGQYFDACVTRASVMNDLTAAYTGRTSKTPSRQSTKKITPQRVIALSEYLETSQLALTLPAVSATHSRRAKQILLQYDLKLSWTGRVRTSVTIACSEIGLQAQKDAKDLFQNLLSTEGPYAAFASIWKLIGSVDNSEDSRKSRSQPRKGRKRIVV